MKPRQRQLYAERIERVVEHIERLDPDAPNPALAELAEIAALSEFHFHRVFRLMTGETPGEALRRIRLARSLPALAATGTVTEASGAAGYATSQGFARALRRQAGTSASEARAGGTLDSLAARLRSPAGEGAAALSVEVVSVEPFRLLAIRNVGDYAELNAGYTRLFDLVLQQMPPEALRGIYGVPYDDPRFIPPEDCRFDCALATGEAGAPVGALSELRLGGGHHARLRHLGSYDALPESIDLLYAAAIVELDQPLGSAPAFVHYLDDPEEVAEAELRSEIYLPLG
ncbi:MAG: GyrI-like domain-containing protein [Sphingomonas sp.]|uniref:AraC family transcriptional regulator n=1 Tax=Sphingomonas sp. TaxID=28214 RepID=UPI001B0FF024|nr:GyrI-like domain-containing protein [Sphingomonas sp.]MBO9621953.1 GyrI-like domain-containing protein [Sphingomonas sp.]